MKTPELFDALLFKAILPCERLEGIHKLESSGLRVTDLVVLIDHEGGVRAKMHARGYQAHAVFTLSEISQTLYQTGRISETQYGVFCIDPRKGGFWKIRFSITPLKPLPVNKRLSQKLHFWRHIHIMSLSMSQNDILRSSKE